jgi:hypothetical protein
MEYVIYILGKNKLKLFSWKFKMAEQFNIKDDIFQKISRFYYKTAAK